MSSKIVILTAPGFESLQWWLRKLAHEGLPSDARQVYRCRRNTIYAVTADGQKLSVKEFGIANFTDSIVYANWHRSKARRSLDNAITLRRLGIETPKPVGAIEVIENGRLTRSYYISRHIDIVGDMHDWAANPEANAAVGDLAALMARLHSHGVLHKDLRPDNIIIKHDRNGRRHLLVIDLNRMEFGVFDHSRQIQNCRFLPSPTLHRRRFRNPPAPLPDLQTSHISLYNIPMPEKLKIYCLNLGEYIETEGGSSLHDVARGLTDRLGFEPLCARVNNKTEGLHYRLYAPKDVEFLSVTDENSARCYVRSLCMILYKAVTRLYPGAQLKIEHSISKGYFCRITAKTCPSSSTRSAPKRPSKYLSARASTPASN